MIKFSLLVISFFILMFFFLVSIFGLKLEKINPMILSALFFLSVFFSLYAFPFLTMFYPFLKKLIPVFLKTFKGVKEFTRLLLLMILI